LVAADTTFVWAKAALPQDNATDEMTAKYILRFLFLISANFFINFQGVKIFKHISANLQGQALCETPRRDAKIQSMENKSRQRDRRCPKPMN
jgi:hypothetical protein